MVVNTAFPMLCRVPLTTDCESAQVLLDHSNHAHAYCKSPTANSPKKQSRHSKPVGTGDRPASDIVEALNRVQHEHVNAAIADEPVACSVGNGVIGPGGSLPDRQVAEARQQATGGKSGGKRARASQKQPVSMLSFQDDLDEEEAGDEGQGSGNAKPKASSLAEATAHMFGRQKHRKQLHVRSALPSASSHGTNAVTVTEDSLHLLSSKANLQNKDTLSGAVFGAATVRWGPPLRVGCFQCCFQTT